ncbi:hypothetical protein P389DRAFT_209225 [Cystobasidium minutum MCA 4210]|uniref:uncharacterized protein n=1 Tax=Cystobasidium minutum MCA 4210 TaxID=1397322 RepID=UPI0034CF7913|eukprot:jgi/Rhomi1/209225/estExt_Genemark1.C_2_t30052
MGPADGFGSHGNDERGGNGNGLELNRMDRIDAESQDDEEISNEDDASDRQNDADKRGLFVRLYDGARHSHHVTWEWIKLHSNFYRIHLLTFTIVPLIASGILYGIDSGEHAYIDCLTLCVSAMTVTGLNPVLMETTSHGQQAIVYFLMSIGNIVAVSIITIIIRRHFFKKRFEHMVRTDPRARRRARDVEQAHEKELDAHPWLHPFHFGEKYLFKHGQNEGGEPGSRALHLSQSGEHASRSPAYSRSGTPSGKPPKKRKRDKLRVDMIRRVDAPVKVNQMNVGGFLSENGGSNRRMSLSSQSGNEPYIIDPAGPSTAVSQDANILEQSKTRSDSPTQISPVETTPKIYQEPPSPRGQRRVSLAELPALRHARDASDNVPMTTIVEGVSRPASVASSVFEDSSDSSSEEAVPANKTVQESTSALGPSRSRRMSDPAHLPSHLSSDLKREFKRVRTMDPPKHHHAGLTSPPVTGNTFPRTQTIEIREPAHPDRPRGYSSAIPHVGAHIQPEGMRRRAATGSSFGAPLSRSMARRGSNDPMPRTLTRGTTSMTTGFGGFPNPVKVVANAAHKRLLPKVATLDMARTTTLQSVYSDRGHAGGESGGLTNIAAGPTRAVSYISFDAVVGRNSRFYSLTSKQRDELGGVEYRALSALLKIVILYFVLVQLIPIIILAPIMQSRHYNWLFREQDQGSLNGAGGWYAAFNVASAYSNAGLSLLDDSMVPFQRSYGYVLVLGFCILAGNTAFPVFLRLAIWTLSKMTRGESRFRESVQFLLDHPRRCFIYLFPSHQTWFLVVMLLVLNCTDWICFIVLDIGSSFLDALPPAAKAIDGLFQAFAVRAAGFSIVPLSETAPALQFLYVVMMYLAVFPIALSIRSTNVYEEKSMGLYDEAEDDDSQTEAHAGSVGSYFAHHARKQLAFDIWWLGLALWAICIVERTNIDDPATDSYFNIFTIMFEVVSAYGTVGLSLGSPNANYSLCGDFRTLSKIILCAVMIRGRHRGLPVAIDRSILLPSDLEALHGPPVDSIPNEAEDVQSPNGSGFSSLKKGATRTSVNRTWTRTRTRTSSGGMRRFSGGQPARRTASSLSATSKLSGKARKPSSPVITQDDQASASPTVPVRRTTPSRPTLNGYLSTIYSEGTSPAVTPQNEREVDAKTTEKPYSTPAVAVDNGAASTSSGDTSGKDAITLADKSDEK